MNIQKLPVEIKNIIISYYATDNEISDVITKIKILYLISSRRDMKFSVYAMSLFYKSYGQDYKTLLVEKFLDKYVENCNDIKYYDTPGMFYIVLHNYRGEFEFRSHSYTSDNVPGVLHEMCKRVIRFIDDN